MCENQGLITELLTDFHMVTPLKKDGRVKGSVLEKVKMKNLDEFPENKNKNKNEVKEDDGDDARTRSVNESEKCLVRKRLRDSSNGSLTDSDKNALASPKRKKGHYELETDPVVLARRQKQIDYGKNTVGYDRYVQAIPKKERKKHHPRTPPKHFKYSRRAWDGMVKVWRQQLHFWDEPNEANDSRKQSRQTNSDSEEQSLDDSLPPDEGKAAI